MNRIYLGFFSELNLSMADNGSIKSFIIDKVDYDKAKIIRYLKNGKKESVGEYVWRNDLEYYVKNYNIKLPDNFIKKIYKSAAAN